MSGDRDPVVDAVVELARSVAHEKLGEAERHGASRMLLDSLGCALGAIAEPVPRIARDVATGGIGSGSCGLIGDRRRSDADLAAFANGVAIRYFDLNDSYASPHGVGHPSDYIAAVLAAAEDSGRGGREVIGGMAVAYELFAALTDALQLGVEGWDHVLAGSIASAVAAGVVFGLDDAGLRQCVSLAMVPNFPLQATRLGELSMWKGCAAGNASRGGVFAARLARAGLSGPPLPFVGRGGFEAVVGIEVDREALRPGRRPPAIGQSHLKRYPSGYFSQGAIDAAIELRSRLDGDGSIAAVQVGTFSYGAKVMAGDPEKWRPATRESADHSLPYVVATALVHGDLDLRRFAPEALSDPAVAEVLRVLEVQEDPECAAAWPETVMTKLAVTTRSGRREETHVRFYRGHAQNPMSDQEIEEKARGLAAGALSDQAFRRLADRVWSLEELASVEELLSLTWP
ncbi:MAG: MmgE/PrpD family protein [Candidatus Dormibacteria bacterium]